MTAFLALFGDALRRARDRRGVVFLIVIGLAFAVLCTSFGFTQPDPRESLRLHLEGFSKRSRGQGPGGLRGALPLRRAPRVDARAPTAEDDLPLGLDHVAVADVEIADVDDFDRVARAAALERAGRGAPRERATGPLTARQRMDAVADFLRDRGWETVLTRAHDDAGASLFVAAATAHLAELEGRWKFGLLFGAKEFPIDGTMSPAAMVIEIERLIALVLGGSVGMLVLLAAFGGALPDLLQKGALELVLARPIGRTRLVLFTYAGATLTVLILTALLFGVCALALGVRSGHDSTAFVACALPATAVFASVYPVAMLTGLLTRHAGFSSLVAFACYCAAGVLAGLRAKAAEFGVASSSLGSKLIDVLYWVAPKTGEITALGQLRLGRAELSDSAFARFRAQFPDAIDAASACGTTALFAAAFLLLTILLFRRRDC